MFAFGHCITVFVLYIYILIETIYYRYGVRVVVMVTSYSRYFLFSLRDGMAFSQRTDGP
jgi:hypothetical protein